MHAKAGNENASVHSLAKNANMGAMSAGTATAAGSGGGAGLTTGNNAGAASGNQASGWRSAAPAPAVVPTHRLAPAGVDEIP